MTNIQELDIAVMEYMLECPECPKNGFKELWGNTANWIEHVISEHNYTPELIKQMFQAWEQSIIDDLEYQAFEYATSEGDMTDRAYEEWKERNI